jgi:hypothetical protein
VLGHDRVSGSLVSRTPEGKQLLAGQLKAVALVILVLVLGGGAEVMAARNPLIWAEGVIVNSDPVHKTFALVQRGRNGATLFTWNGQTHEWSGLDVASDTGTPVDPVNLLPNRAVRVLFQRHGRALVVKRIIILNPVADRGRGLRLGGEQELS